MAEKTDNIDEVGTNIHKTEKRYIEITSEDYELALAGKVIHKSYKMLLGVILVIVGLLAFLGYKFNNAIETYEKELSNSKDELSELKDEFEAIKDTLLRKTHEINFQRELAGSYYTSISTAFGQSSSDMFNSFIEATRSNLKHLDKIEKSVDTNIEAALIKTQKVEDQIKNAEDSLFKLNKQIDNITKIESKIEANKNEIESVIHDFIDKYSIEHITLKLNEPTFSKLLQNNVCFCEEKIGRKKKKVITGLLTSNQIHVNNPPPNFTHSGSKYKLEILGNSNSRGLFIKLVKQIDATNPVASAEK